MPRKLSRSKVKRVLSVAGAAGVAGALGMGAATASADVGSCVAPQSKQAFHKFGDTGAYFLASGGSFEGALRWAHSGPAAIVAGNEPFMLNVSTDDQSLRLGEGGTVTTAMCVTPAMTHMRFVAKAHDDGPLTVTVRFFDPLARVIDVETTTVQPAEHASWAPSANIDMRTGRLASGTVGYAAVTFKSQGDWQVDDVFIDPYAR